MEDAGSVALMVERLFEAFNRRDAEAVLRLCHPDVEFLPVTARLANRSRPYVGHDGMRRYFADVEQTWEELTVSAHELIAKPGFRYLVIGRVVARSKDRGLRDFPAGWVWQMREGLFSYGRVYEDPEEAARAVSGEPRPG